MPPKSGMLERERKLFEHAMKQEKEHEAEKAGQAAYARKKLGVVDPNAPSWPAKKQHFGLSHPTLKA